MKKSRTAKKGNILKSIVVLLAVVLLAAGSAFITLGMTVFGNKIFPNVYVDTILLEGKTQEEALIELEARGWNEHTERILTVNSFLDTSIEIDPVEAGVIIDAESAVQAAARYGRLEES